MKRIKRIIPFCFAIILALSSSANAITVNTIVEKAITRMNPNDLKSCTAKKIFHNRMKDSGGDTYGRDVTWAGTFTDNDRKFRIVETSKSSFANKGYPAETITNSNTYYFDYTYMYLKLKNHDSWIKFNSADTYASFMWRAMDAKYGASDCLNAAANLKLIGTEKLGKTSCYRIDGVIKGFDIATAMRGAYAIIALQGVSGSGYPESLKKLKSTVPVSILIDQKTFQIVKIRYDFKIVTQELYKLNGLNDYTITAYTETTTYSDIDKTKDFSIPSAAIKARLEDSSGWERDYGLSED